MKRNMQSFLRLATTIV